MVDEPVKKNRHGKTPIDSAIQAHIGQQLRAIFDETASEPVPDNLLKLLDALGTGTDAQMGPGMSAGRKAPESA